MRQLGLRDREALAAGRGRACTGEEEGDAAIGAGLGLLAVGLDLMLGLSGHVAAKLGVGSIHIPLPYSALAYSAGAVAVESLYRVIPIPIVLWIVCGVLTRGRGVTPTFWVVAALTALLEPLSQATILGERPGMMTALGLFILGFNLVCAWLFWRRGVASPLVARLAFYAVWHVLLGPRLVGA